jgi:S-adenosylmethionine hydrolase
MGRRFDTVSFLSDLGRVDESVGVVTAIIRDLAPHAQMVHLTHEVPAYDVRAGSLALARAIGHVPSGVVLAAVDAGPSCARPFVAIEVADAAGVLVGPDNGLLAPAVAMAGGAERAVVLDDSSHHLPSPGSLSFVRDVLAPVAAHLCNGVDLARLGTVVDADQLLPGVVPLPRPVEGGEQPGVVCEVLWVDRFGSVQLNIGPDEVHPWATPTGSRVQVVTTEATRTAERVDHAGVLGAGSFGLVVDAHGMMALVLDRRSAAEELQVAAGDQVTLTALAGVGGTTTSVRLGPTR